MLALIDLDVVLHAVSAAAENSFYAVPVDDGAELFQYKKDAKHYCLEHNIDPDAIIKSKDPEPIANVCHSAKVMVGSIVEKSGAADYIGFLSGPNNFRKTICPLYKAHRTEERPTHFQALKDYMLQYMKVEMKDGFEADDLMGIYQTLQMYKSNYPTIICTIDKDLDMISGYHYNWSKDSVYYVSEHEGALHFWSQMLAGDPVDGIVGIRGIGMKTAQKLLEALPENEWECYVGLRYAMEFDDPEEIFERNKKLLWILRAEELPDEH